MTPPTWYLFSFPKRDTPHTPFNPPCKRARRRDILDGPYHSVLGDRVVKLGKPYREVVVRKPWCGGSGCWSGRCLGRFVHFLMDFCGAKFLKNLKRAVPSYEVARVAVIIKTQTGCV